MDISPGFAADMRRAQQLEEQRQHDPRAIVPLIQVYERLVGQLEPGQPPTVYATIRYLLGNVYVDLPTGDRASNLAQAITCYQQALRFWTPEAAPLDYATTQNNLGGAYQSLPTGDWASNLAQAISCFHEALRFRTPEAAPLKYAMTQNNLGEAYRNLPTGDRASNLVQAINCYRQALRFYTPEVAPLDYAMTQNNLGITYADLPTGDWASNLTQAINCYRQALRFYTPDAAPLDYAMTQNNLGIAYRNLPTGDQASNLAQAISCYQEALRFRTPEAAPLEYATTQNNLGIAYQSLPTGDRASNLAQAISCYQEALRFYTPEAAPLDYATIQNNLGTAYRDLPTGDRASNLAQAISCYQEALCFQTPEALPSECRRTNVNLADLYFAQQDWKDALDAYRAAIDAGERLYHADLSAESKATEVAANITLYRNAAFTAVRCGQIAGALLILEQGKTRLLTEALRLHVARPVNIPDEIWIAFEQAGAAVRAAQAGNTDVSQQERDTVRVYTAREQAARDANTALDTAIDRVRTYAPAFLHPIDLSTIQGLLPDEHSVLVTFCITDQGSIGFVVSQNHDESVQAVEIPTFTKGVLGRLLVEWDAEGRAVGGWLGAYSRYLVEATPAAFAVWQAMITHVLAEISQRLLTPILSILPPNIERIIFLPSAELFLLPLHALPLSENELTQICDRYQISYAPSMEVLSEIRARAMQTPTPELYAVINPQADPQLVFTLSEGAAIARLFTQCNIDEGRRGTKQRVIAEASGRSYVHFSCHGSYDWNDPNQSGLALADSRLTLAELQQETIDLSNARLITLSACETGISDVFKGSAEEYVGIPAGFLLAGVPCVVSSLWAVPDLSTTLLMERFYGNHLSKGMDFAAALREAQLWVRDLRVGEVTQYAEQCYHQTAQKEQAALFQLFRYYRSQTQQNPEWRPFAHPYYWAAFTVNGM